MRAVALVGLLGWTAVACGQPLSEEERQSGFVSMFNGEDFSGWQFDGSYALPEERPENWKVEDGVIKLSGGGRPNLGSQWDYEDFEMRFEWRAMRERYNSGFYIRSRRKVGNNQINLAKGGEGRFFGGKMNGGKPVPELQKPAGEWNEWRVRIVRDKVTFWCNGELAWEGSEFGSQRGHIGLQAEGAPLEFRKLRIKEIGYENLDRLDRWQAARGWKQEGDALVAAGKTAPLVTKGEKFRDYHLRLEWRAGQGAAGGIGLRGGDPADAVVRIGDLAEGSGRLAGQAATKSKPADNPLGQWNYMEVTVQGGQVKVWLNGATVAEDATLGDAPAGGGLTLLVERGPLSFRNVRIRELQP